MSQWCSLLCPAFSPRFWGVCQILEGHLLSCCSLWNPLLALSVEWPILIPTWVLGLLLSVEMDERPDNKNSGKALLGSVLQQGGVRTNNRLCLPEPWGGWAHSLCGVRVGLCPGVRTEEWFRWFNAPSVPWVQGAHVVLYLCSWPLAFAPGFSEVAIVFFFFNLCIFWVQYLLQLHMHTVIFCLIQFLCINILLFEERCV